MKITLDIPDTTKVITLQGVFSKDMEVLVASKIIETSELYDGAEFICNWCEVAE